MGQDSSFADLLARLRERDNKAATGVVRRFARRLIGLARRQLNARLRRKLDPEDVVQSVLDTVFTRLSAGQFELGGWDSLWLLLARITARKCGKWAEHYTARRRDVRREAALEGPEEGKRAPLQPPEPTPVEAVTLAETIGILMSGLKDRHRPILARALQGESVAEISAAVERSERTVQRVLERVRDRLHDLSAAEGETGEESAGR